MRSTITSRGQTVVPGPIRVVPVDADPIAAFRGSGAGGSTAKPLPELLRAKLEPLRQLCERYAW